MGKLLAANNAGTTLASSLSPGSAIITLASGSGAQFPHPTGGDWFLATLIPASSTTGLPNEIVMVTNLTGDTATVVRAQEGTTALTFAPGDLFQNLWTAGSFRSLSQIGDLQAQAGNWAVDTGTANAVVIALTPALTSYSAATGIPIRIKKVNIDNTGAVTVNVNGLGAVPILSNHGGGNLTAGQLNGGGVFDIIYDGTNFQITSDRVVPQGTISNSQLASMPPNTVKSNLTGSNAQPADNTTAQIAAAVGPLIPAGTITNAQQANMPANTVKANFTGAAAAPANFTTLQMAQALPANSLTNAQRVQMAAGTVKANLGGSTANEGDVTLAALLAGLGTVKVTVDATPNGHVIIGPLIINWGVDTTAITNPNQQRTATFDQPFTSQMFGALAIIRNTTPSNSIPNVMCWVSNSLTQAVFESNGYQSGSYSSVAGYFWLAWGI